MFPIGVISAAGSELEVVAFHGTKFAVGLALLQSLAIPSPLLYSVLKWPFWATAIIGMCGLRGSRSRPRGNHQLGNSFHPLMRMAVALSVVCAVAGLFWTQEMKDFFCAFFTCFQVLAMSRSLFLFVDMLAFKGRLRKLAKKIAPTENSDKSQFRHCTRTLVTAN